MAGYKSQHFLINILLIRIQGSPDEQGREGEASIFNNERGWIPIQPLRWVQISIQFPSETFIKYLYN